MPPGLRVVVFGASTGIGVEIAREYARHGAHLVLVARQEDVLKSVARQCEELGATGVHVLRADLSSRSGNMVAAERALGALSGHVDVVVLNHVLGWWGWWLSNSSATTSQHFDTVEQMFAVNTLSYIYLATLLLPALETSKGRLIVVSSGAGQMGLPKVSPYAATKHALHGFFDSLRLELQDKHIPVSLTLCVLGRIDTEVQRNNVGGAELSHVPAANVTLTAQAIVTAGNERVRMLFYPPSQGLAIVSMLRPLFPALFDSFLLKVAQ